MIKQRIVSTRETMDAIRRLLTEQTPGVLQRFGDGDVRLALGGFDMLQNANANLSNLMKEAFSLHGEGVMKCLPLHCPEWNSSEEGMFPGNHEGNASWCGNILTQFLKLSPESNKQGFPIYSPVALAFLATIDTSYTLEWLRFLRNQNVSCLIGNHEIPAWLVEKLFGCQTVHIPTPSSQSFSQISQIRQSAMTVLSSLPKEDFSVVITSMGCAGRPLQVSLYKELVEAQNRQIFFFDFGSLMDALMGKNTRAWIQLSKFDPHSILDCL